MLYRNIQRFDESSINKYPSSDAAAKGEAIDALKLSCNDRLNRLSIVILSEDDGTPVSKRPRQVSPTLSADDDDDIGHVKVCSCMSAVIVIRH